MVNPSPEFTSEDFWELTPLNQRVRDDPYPGYSRLHDAGRLLPTSIGIWISPSHPVCSQVLKNPHFGRGEALNGNLRNSLLTANPPEYTRLRRLVSGAFTPRLVARLRSHITELVNHLIDQALAQGEFDAVGSFAQPLPAIVMSELIGVPTCNQDRFTDWSATLARSLVPNFMLTEAIQAELDIAWGQFEEYICHLAELRRRRPADDLLSALVSTASTDDDMLSISELVATCIALTFAGHETTSNLIANGILALTRNPEKLDWFRENPQEAWTVVDELLRFDSPVQLTLRTALHDSEVDGVPFRSGEQILLVLGAANRDPTVFSDPDHLDFLHRPESERHLAFGLGSRYCLGAALARLEGEVALNTFAQRVRNPRLAPTKITYRDSLFLRGPASLQMQHQGT